MSQLRLGTQIGGNLAWHQGNLELIPNIDSIRYKNLDIITSKGGQTIGGSLTATQFIGAVVGNASTATTLQTARTINGTSFNGSTNITTANWGTARNVTVGNTAKSVNGSANVAWTLAEIGAVNRVGDTMTGALTATQFNGPLSGNASTATTLQTARTINGTSFNGSANITTANWGTARNLTIGNTAKSVNGSANVAWSLTEIGAVNRAGDTMTGNLIAPQFIGALSGNATTATTLQTARTINGTSFNGSANITTDNWGTARNVTIGNTAKSVNGSANVSWTLAEIGVAAASHTHPWNQITGQPATATRWPTYAEVTETPATTASRTDGSTTTLLQAKAMNDHRTSGDHDERYVNKSGDTMTGNIVFQNVVPNEGWARGFVATDISGTTKAGIGILGQGENIRSAYIGLGATPWQTSTENGMSVTGTGIVFTGPLSGNGINLTNLNASNLASGTVPVARLSGSYTINASTATTLQTARTINGTSFNGSANITTANWGTARNLTIGNTAKSVNGSANVVWSLTEIGAANANDTVNLTGNQTIAGTKTFSSAIVGSLNGNASTATTLQTARTINGTSFNGSANITTANWGTARNVTIGDTTKSVNGSANVAWTLAEIGLGTAARRDVTVSNSDDTPQRVIKYGDWGWTGKAIRVPSGTSALTLQNNGVYSDLNGSISDTPDIWGILTSYFRDDIPHRGYQIYCAQRSNLTELKIYAQAFTGSVEGSSTPNVTGWKELYHTGFKPTPADVGAVAKVGDTITGRLNINHPIDSNGWPNATNNDINNYINRSRFTIGAYNNGLHFIANSTENTRIFGIQSGHHDYQFAANTGSLSLNPFGGNVVCGEGISFNNGSVRLSRNIATSDSVAQIMHIIDGTDTVNFLSRTWKESSSSLQVWEKFGDATIQYSIGENGNEPATLRFDVSNGNIISTGNITGFSDISLKTNIERISDSLDKVKQLSGYTFDRTDIDCPRQTGVIAQEVQKVLPEAVLPQTDGKLTVAYGNLVGLLIEAIKELNEKVESLEKERNKSLIDKVKDLF